MSKHCLGTQLIKARPKGVVSPISFLLFHQIKQYKLENQFVHFNRGTFFIMCAKKITLLNQGLVTI